MANVKEIVADWLKANGYDGLCNDVGCGCTLGDLMTCGEPSEYCVPGWRRCDEACQTCPEGPQGCTFGGHRPDVIGLCLMLEEDE